MLTFRTIDPVTGLTVEELPGARLTSDLVQIIGRGDPLTIEAPWPDRMPARWRTATTPGRMVLLCEDDERIWAGGVITELGFGHGPTLTVSAESPEQILARAYLPDVTYNQIPQTDLMAALGLDWLAQYFNGRTEVGASKIARDRTYADADDKARLDAMQDLMGVINGPEFTTWWETKADGSVGIVGAAADRLGLAASADHPVEHELYPDEWSVKISYEDGRGAPIVKASATTESTGDGEHDKVTATATADDLLAAGWPPVEYRFSPETGSVNPDVIADYAEGRLADLRGGTTTLEAKCRIDNFPLHTGLRLGDDVTVVLQQAEMPRGSRDIVQYAPGLAMLVGSVRGLREAAPGLWVDDFGAPVEILADCRLLGWQMSAEQNEITHVTAVLDLREVRW